ncbi:MAG: acetyl/propionyl/methylcrotonyl-CoA carboxylase subunit alpha [Betaproteobacteria bacterium]|nr:acetyl/propionyl/methylcrotonyl-CoA carboxylase subunit alpha [Betaproteobacteria bacterium]
MFERILIANRGEIACRVMKTAHRLGMRTVAVYSEADAGARHVRLADEAVRLGAAAASESYLAGEKIIAAARRTGAQAIHPGYGFLSENADFAEACAAAGIVFIGPPPGAIRAMGSKAAAKTLMDAAGVPLTPGYHGDDQDPGRLHQEAEALGYPVLIKAVAGGGGKGMRRVDKGDDFLAALAACQREAAASFGDARVLVEQYVARARHIEMQVFADRQGHCVHLFERDCSVQRRHQKVLEEAPAPGMSPEQRQRMGAAAVAAARAVGYVGAGTVEFIARDDGSFYFMEMNTRLQVEHPVSEMITGLDLVEWQLRVAAGEPLPLAQEQLVMRGHAIEARLYAEDADRGFLPAAGRLLRLKLPRETLHVRVDAGVEEGDEITPDYDPMIAKLIVWDADRTRALGRLRLALAEIQVAGVASNAAFLSRLASCPAYASADLDTGFIERQRALLFPIPGPIPRDVVLIAALGELLGEGERAREAALRSSDPHSPWHAQDGWRMNHSNPRSLAFRDRDGPIEVQVLCDQERWILTVQGVATVVCGHRQGGRDLTVEIDDRRLSAGIVAEDDKRHVFLEGTTYLLVRDDPRHGVEDARDAGGGLISPMPGKVVALLVNPGQQVEKGTPLLILEAMKMEHTITAPATGSVAAFHFPPGTLVKEGSALLDFDWAP